MSNGLFSIPERAVLDRLGISHAMLKERRGQKGGRWSQGAHGRAMWSEEGIAALVAELAGPAGAADKSAPPEAAVAPEKAATPPPEAVETLLVWRCTGYPNKALLLCRRAAEPEPTVNTARRVMVGDRSRFAPGMAVLARLRFGHTDLYDFEGNPDAPAVGCRLPKRPGHW
jgi:hypothetical protein